MPLDPLKPPPSYGTLATALSVRGMFIAQASGIILGRGASSPKDHADIRKWCAEIEEALLAYERAEIAAHQARPPLSVVKP